MSAFRFLCIEILRKNSKNILLLNMNFKMLTVIQKSKKIKNFNYKNITNNNFFVNIFFLFRLKTV